MAGIEPNTIQKLWWALQTAHNRYKNATAALDALLATSTSQFPSSERDFHIEAAAGIQRTAFEAYIEARLQLSEFLSSEQNNGSKAPASDLGKLASNGITFSRRVLVSTAATLLLLATLAAREVAHDRGQIVDLQRAREKATAELKQTESQMQALVYQIDALKAANLNMVGSTRTAAAPAQRDRASGGHRPARRRAASGGRFAKNHQGTLQQQARRGSHLRVHSHALEALRGHRSQPTYSVQGRPAA